MAILCTQILPIWILGFMLWGNLMRVWSRCSTRGMKRFRVFKLSLNPCQWTFIFSRVSLNTSLKTIGNPSSELSTPTPATAGWEQLLLSPSQMRAPSPFQSLRLPLDQGIPLPPYLSPPSSPLPPPMVTQTVKSYKLKQRGQRCRPREKSQQVRMSLKLSIVKLQDKYGLSLVQGELEQVLEEICEGSSHDTLGCRACHMHPETGVHTYCLQSIYNPLHFTHRCADLDYACGVDPLA